MTRVAVSQISSPSRVLINERGPKVKRRATLQYSHYLAPESQRGRPCPHMSRDAFPRFFFFDSDEPEQRHRVLIEFGLCAGVALATDHHPLRACPFISSWLEHFLQNLLDWGFFAGLGFSLMLSTDPHKLQLMAACQSVCTHESHLLSTTNARTLSLVTSRPFARVCLLRLSREVPRDPNSRPTLTNTHSAGGIANGAGAHRTWRVH